MSDSFESASGKKSPWQERSPEAPIASDDKNALDFSKIYQKAEGASGSHLKRPSYASWALDLPTLSPLHTPIETFFGNHHDTLDSYTNELNEREGYKQRAQELQASRDKLQEHGEKGKNGVAVDFFTATDGYCDMKRILNEGSNPLSHAGSRDERLRTALGNAKMDLEKLKTLYDQCRRQDSQMR